MSLSRRQPRGDLVDQRVAQARVLDALDRLADEGLDQQPLGLLCRNAARLEIEQEVVVKRAGGRAMTALHIVGVDFQFRLAVGLGLLGQEQRMRRHLGVGLLRLRRNRDSALEYTAAFAVEYR